jgi:hypothetical protein
VTAVNRSRLAERDSVQAIQRRAGALAHEEETAP